MCLFLSSCAISLDAPLNGYEEGTEVAALVACMCCILCTRTVKRSADYLRELNAKDGKRRNVLGEHIADCNPYSPRWEDFGEMTPQQQKKRTENHIRKLTYQWFQCAQKAKNEDIQQYYAEKVRRITNRDAHLWKSLVHNIEVDDSMEVASKVLN